MLQIIIPAEERWDEEHEEFIVSKKEQKLMFFVNETPQYVFGLKISNDKILLN